MYKKLAISILMCCTTIGLVACSNKDIVNHANITENTVDVILISVGSVAGEVAKGLSLHEVS